MAGLKERLGKLYNSLETGKIEIEHLAPRIKDLKAQIDGLEAKRNEITGESTNTARLPFDLKALYEFAKDLTEILKDGTIDPAPKNWTVYKLSLRVYNRNEGGAQAWQDTDLQKSRLSGF